MVRKNTPWDTIPKDWDVVVLGEYSEISRGGSPRPIQDYLTSSCHGINWIKIGDVSKNSKYIFSTAEKIIPEGMSKSRAVFSEDLILSNSMSFGRPYILKIDGCIHDGWLVIQNYQSAFDKEYLYYCLGSEFIFQQYISMAAGSSVQNLNKDKVSAVIIAKPPIKEQFAIAEALSDVDSLISSLQKLIEKKKAIKQGAMQELLTGKKRLPGFSQKWVQKYLKEIIAPRKARANPAEIDNQRCIELEHIEPNSGRILGYCESKLQKSLKAFFYPNDILWGKLRPYLRKYAHPQFSGVCSTEFWVFNAVDKYACNDFLYYLLQTEYVVSAANSTTGTKMPRADWNLVQELEVKIPPDKREQQAIAQVLSDMDSEIEQLEKKLAKYQQIKQGMMQELLTGRIRLMDADGKEQPKTQILQDKQPQPAHNHHFDDAVMIAGIVNAFYSEKYPLGRKKIQKLLYLVRRKEQADISAFHKKAAGPYADEVRYKGGEPIAQKNKYIQVKRNEKGSCFEKGAQMQQALTYLKDWGKQADVDWLVSQFHYTSVNELELLATVDMAICDLRQEDKEISVASIKDLIRSNKEWRDKLKKAYFKDADIQRAINHCQELFPDKEG